MFQELADDPSLDQDQPSSAGFLLQALPCLPNHNLLANPPRHTAQESGAGTQGVKQYPDRLVRSSELGCSIVY